jgi:small subunit ribosomal protein S17
MLNEAMTTTNEHSLKKQRVGIVTSSKNDKTITVTVERKLRHPMYHKFVKRNTKFMAHDEQNACGVGDLVRIVESRPLSARKRWRLVEIIEKAK